MQFKRPLPLFFLIILVIGILIPSAHASTPIYVRSVEKDCNAGSGSCVSGSVSTNAGDTIIIHTACYGNSAPSVSDSLNTVLTQPPGTGFSNGEQIFVGTSSGGSDIVTIATNCGPVVAGSFSVDIYRFVTGIGVTNKNTVTSAVVSFADTLTMIIQPNSFIYETWDIVTGNSQPTLTGTSGQAVRDTFQFSVVGGTGATGITMDRQYSNGGSTGSSASATGLTGPSSTFYHQTIELLATGGSVTQVSNCYGNCGSPAVTAVNTNSTKGINFNVTQTWFYENQILNPALILNESARVACTYGTAQCPSANTLVLSLYATQTNCLNSVPFTSTCPGILVFSQSSVNPAKGLFTITPNYSVFAGQWIALAFSATQSGMQINDTNTLVNIFNVPGTPASISQATPQGQSKANVYAWATGNTVTGGGIIPTPTACSQNSDLSCFMIASACALTPSNCFVGGAIYLFIYFTIFVIAISICITYINNTYETEFHFPPMIFFLFFLIELFMFTAMGLIPQYVTIVIFIFTALSLAGYFGSQFVGNRGRSD